VVGLGNPGSEYARTRHNIGFIIVEELAQRWQAERWTKKRDARIALDRPHRAVLVEPLRYMNESGPPTLGIATFYKVPPPRTLVVVDDLDLPFGRLRMRESGTSGGHNGLKSLIEVFGTGFPRLRVGIGRDREHPEAIRHVLGAFGPDEQAALGAVVDRAIAGIETWLSSGAPAAMNLVNVTPAPAQPPKQASE
jgi:PTH1 family peptidyl-tRNA hydrolase